MNGSAGLKKPKRPKRALEELKLANPKCILACAALAVGKAAHTAPAKKLGLRSNFVFCSSNNKRKHLVSQCYNYNDEVKL